MEEDLILDVFREKRVPYTPNPEQVKISIEKTSKNKILVKVSIAFRSEGFHVDLGQLKRENSVFSVDAKVKAWTGPSIQAITVEKATYNLGFLEQGDYMFVFNVNGQHVKGAEFKVGTSTQQGQPLTLPNLF